MFLIFNFSRKGKILHCFGQIFIFSWPFLVFIWLSSCQILVAWDILKWMWKNWNDVVQLVETFFVEKTNNTATIFTIYMEHHCRVKHWDLAFRSAFIRSWPAFDSLNKSFGSLSNYRNLAAFKFENTFKYKNLKLHHNVSYKKEQYCK